MAQVAILKSLKANLDLKRKYPFKIIRVLGSCTTSSSGQINRLSITNQSCCSNSNHCNVEEGDCDMDSHCKAPLMCGNDSCRNYFSTLDADWKCTADCCKGILIIVEAIAIFVKTININVTVIH